MKALQSYEDVKAPRKPKTPTRVKAINAKTGGHRFPENVCEPLRAFLRGLPCILFGRVDRDGTPHVCKGRIVVCHNKTKGSSGPDLGNTFPGCEWGAHQDQEGHTKEFEYQWKLRLKIECRRYTSLFYDTLAGKKWKHQQKAAS